MSIAKLDGCYSMGIGMTPSVDGKHQVSIGNGCASTGIVLHELMHAIGTNFQRKKANIPIYFKGIHLYCIPS